MCTATNLITIRILGNEVQCTTMVVWILNQGHYSPTEVPHCPGGGGGPGGIPGAPVAPDHIRRRLTDKDMDW